MTHQRNKIRINERYIDSLSYLQTLDANEWIDPIHYGNAGDLAKRIEEVYELKKNGGSEALQAYVRNSRLALYEKADRVFVEVPG